MRRNYVPQDEVVVENLRMIVRDDLAVLVALRRRRHDLDDLQISRGSAVARLRSADPSYQ